MDGDFEVIGGITEVEMIAVGRKAASCQPYKHALDVVVGVSSKVWRRSAWPMVRYVLSNYTGTRRTREDKDQAVPGLTATHGQNTEARFAICIDDGGYVDDLKVRTVYQILPDESAARSDCVRVVDETGEDYLYPAALFVPVEVPPEAAKALLLAAR